MKLLQLPVTSDPSQEFTTILGETSYMFRIDYNVRGGVWHMDISTANDEPLLMGVPLVVGSDFLSNGRVLDGSLYLVDYSNKGRDPSSDDLGDCGLIWEVNDD